MLEPLTWAVLLIGLFTLAGILRHWPRGPVPAGVQVGTSADAPTD